MSAVAEDYTCVSPLERFVARIETCLRDWNVQDVQCIACAGCAHDASQGGRGTSDVLGADKTLVAFSATHHRVHRDVAAGT
jgi:hypothetical protein